jgi:hypothetical protein
MYDHAIDEQLDEIVPDGRARPKFFWSDPATHHKSRDWIRSWAYMRGTPVAYRPNVALNAYETGYLNIPDAAPYAPVANPYALKGLAEGPSSQSALLALGAAAVGGWLLGRGSLVLGLGALAGGWYLANRPTP